MHYIDDLCSSLDLYPQDTSWFPRTNADYWFPFEANSYMPYWNKGVQYYRD